MVAMVAMVVMFLMFLMFLMLVTQGCQEKLMDKSNESIVLSLNKCYVLII